METNAIETVDDLDLQILNLLQQDCRLSFNKIASKLGISAGTAYYRTKHMENNGVLKGYTAILDSVKLGYNLTTVILIQTEGGHLTEVENELAKTSNVIAVYDITGDFDIAVITKF